MGWLNFSHLEPNRAYMYEWWLEREGMNSCNPKLWTLNKLVPATVRLLPPLQASLAPSPKLSSVVANTHTLTMMSVKFLVARHQWLCHVYQWPNSLVISSTHASNISMMWSARSFKGIRTTGRIFPEHIASYWLALCLNDIYFTSYPQQLVMHGVSELKIVITTKEK